MIHTTRRRFLAGLATLGAATAVPASLMFASRIVKAADELTPDPKQMAGWKISGAHWGAFRARVEADRVVEIRPFEFDKHPTDILKGTLDVIYSPSRVRYPMVRLDWY